MSERYGELISHNYSNSVPKATFKATKRSVKEVDEVKPSTTPNPKRRKQLKEEDDEEYNPCEEEKRKSVSKKTRVSEYGITCLIITRRQRTLLNILNTLKASFLVLIVVLSINLI